MFCPNCGTKCESAFCPNCGTKLDFNVEDFAAGGDALRDPAAPAEQPTSGCGTAGSTFSGYTPEATQVPPQSSYYYTPAQNYQAPQPAPEVPSAGYANPYPAAPVRTQAGSGALAARRVAASPLFLVAVIIHTITAVFGIYNALTVSYVPGIDSRGASIALTVLTISFIALIVVGLWITYGSAKANPDGKMTTAGLTIIKTMLIIFLVLFCILFAIVLILLLAAGGKIGSILNDLPYGYGSELSYYLNRSSGFVAAVIFILITCGVLTIIWFAGALKTISCVKRSIRTDVPTSSGISGFVAVFCFIMALISIITNIIRVIGVGALSYSSYSAGFASSVLSASLFFTFASCVSLVLFGILIFKYLGSVHRARQS